MLVRYTTGKVRSHKCNLRNNCNPKLRKNLITLNPHTQTGCPTALNFTKTHESALNFACQEKTGNWSWIYFTFCREFLRTLHCLLIKDIAVPINNNHKKMYCYHFVQPDLMKYFINWSSFGRNSKLLFGGGGGRLSGLFG